MIVKTIYGYCESEDLSLIDEVFGKGTLKKEPKKVFKCNNCDEELSLDEMMFDEVFLVHNPEKGDE